MIFMSFILILGLFLIPAHLSGTIGYFINPDSLLIDLLGLAIAAIGIGYGDYKPLISGIRMIFSFKKQSAKNPKVKTVFGALIISTIAVGVCSTIQGIFSGVFSGTDISLSETVSIAMFTTVYSIIISVFLLFPVYIRSRE